MLPQVENSEKKGALQEVEALVATVGNCNSLAASLYLTPSTDPFADTPSYRSWGQGVG